MYHPLADVINGKVQDGPICIAVQVNDVSPNGMQAVVVQEGYHALLNRLDDSPVLRKGMNVMLCPVLASHVSATENCPAHVVLFAHSDTKVTQTPCPLTTMEPGRMNLTVDVEPLTQPSGRRLSGSKTCDWCTDPSTPFCSGSGKAHDICHDCAKPKKSSPFCPQTGHHH